MKYRGSLLENIGLPRKMYLDIRRQSEKLGRPLEQSEIDAWFEKHRKLIFSRKDFEKRRCLRWLFKKYTKEKEKKEKFSIAKYARERGYNLNGFSGCVRRFCIGGITKEWFDKAEQYYIKRMESKRLREKVREFLPNKKDEDLAIQRITLRGWTFDEAIRNAGKKLWERKR